MKLAPFAKKYPCGKSRLAFKGLEPFGSRLVDRVLRSFHRRICGPWIATGVVLMALPPLAAAETGGPLAQFVGFEEPRYQVDALASTFRVRVVLEPLREAGLISYGVTLRFDANAFEVGRPGIEVPAMLDFNGFLGPGAFVESGPGFASVKGTVDLTAQAALRYDASLLATFVLVPRDAVPGVTSDLLLEPFYTAGPNEALFVTGDGGVLDSELVFGRTTIEFIPEPGPVALSALGAALLARTLRRDRAWVTRIGAAAASVKWRGGA